jgi:hypothetical protein
MQPKLLVLRKQLEAYSLEKSACGLPSFFSYNKKTGEIKDFIECRNKILYSGGDVLAQCLIGNPAFAVNTMYMEFVNNPSGPVTPPSFDRTGGIDYYNGLASVDHVDFLRIPFTVNPLINSSNPDLYKGNQSTFFAISEGSEGRWGKSFPVGSAVYGAALVAAPEVGDPTKDTVFSRVYTGIGTIIKEAGFEVGVTWTTRFN